MKKDQRRIFQRNILQGIGSSGVAFAITLFTTPLMTRLYPAEAYGVYGLLNSAAVILSSAGLLGLPIALSRTRDEAEQVRLLSTSIQIIALLLSFVFGMVLLLYICAPEITASIPTLLLFLFPAILIFHAIQRISDSLTTADGRFSEMAKARVANSLSARGLTLLVGWTTHATAGSMLLGDTTGKALQILITTKRSAIVRNLRSIKWRPHFASIKNTIEDYRDFVLFSNIASILPIAMTFGLQALIGYRFGVASTGQYVLAQSILALPVTILVMGAAPIIFHRLVTAVAETPEQLQRLTILAMIILLAIGLACMLPIMLYGPELYAFFLGEKWRISGALAATLCWPQIFAFSLAALLSIFRVTKQLRLWFYLELSGVTLVLAGFFFLGNEQSFDSAVARMVWLLLGYQILMHAGILWSARRANYK